MTVQACTKTQVLVDLHGTLDAVAGYSLQWAAAANGDTGAPQLLPHDNLAAGVDAMDLEDALGEIETDRSNLHSGRFLLEVASQRPTYGAQTPDTGAVHPIRLIRESGAFAVSL